MLRLRPQLPLLPWTLAVICHLAPGAAAAQESQFRDLFENGSLEGWTLVNGEASSFALRNGVLQVRGERGWLRSPRTYGDFVLRAELRFVEPDSDTGLFLRTGTGLEFIRGWPGDAYQVQLRDISVNVSDRPLPLAHLYRHRVPDGPTDYDRERVFALYGGPGEWQQLEVSAQGESLEVKLNGEIVTRASGLVNAEGYLGFQSESGLIEFRQLRIAEAP